MDYFPKKTPLIGGCAPSRSRGLRRSTPSTKRCTKSARPPLTPSWTCRPRLKSAGTWRSTWKSLSVTTCRTTTS
jgi:hypothetical protein